MAIFVGPAIAFLIDSILSSSKDEKNMARRDRLCDLGRSTFDIYQRVRDTHETLSGLLPKEQEEQLIWAKAVSISSFQTVTDATTAFGKLAIPAIPGGSENDISQLSYRRFLMRKIELELQAVLVCMKHALLAASKLKTALTTYDDLAKSGTIGEDLANEMKHHLFLHFPTADIPPPSMPSNEKIFGELRERDFTTKAYTEEDPSLADTEKWIASL